MDKEEGEALGGARQVGLGIDPPQHRVVGDACVEVLDQPAERRLAAGSVENVGHGHPVLGHCQTLSFEALPGVE
jgi:hypothetical protein